jgi:hypothetical protein
VEKQLVKIEPPSALTATGEQSQMQLPPAEYVALGALMEKTARRYPNQDLSKTLPEYMIDYERLALKFSFWRVELAISNLRICPQQHFFPAPDEVATEIEKIIAEEKRQYYEARDREQHIEYEQRKTEYEKRIIKRFQLQNEFETYKRLSPLEDESAIIHKFYDQLGSKRINELSREARTRTLLADVERLGLKEQFEVYKKKHPDDPILSFLRKMKNEEKITEQDYFRCWINCNG